jgi:hypothetical protein
VSTVEWAIVGIFATIVVGLISVIYVSLVKRIDALQTTSKNGLALKVDHTEFNITKEWQREISNDMKLVIKDLSDANTKEHAGILLEIRRIQNDRIRS